MTAKCEVCGENFEAQRADARLCSAKCRKTASRRANDPDAMLAEARRLTELQRSERGTVPWVFEGQKVEVPGPYVPTAEREARAAEIGRLRREAARIKYPTKRAA